MAEQKLSTAQRMMNFSALTRQNIHMLPSQEASNEFATLQFTLPKTRVLAKTFLKVDVDCDIKHASKTTLSPKHDYDFLKIIRKIAMDINIGFMPFNLTGAELGMFNTLTTHPQKLVGGGDRLLSDAQLEASAPGANNKFSFTLELKNTLNDNSLQGLIMLQNQSTAVTLNVDIGALSDIFNGQEGFTGTLNKIKITPAIVTYTIPQNEAAYPDISLLKITHSKTQNFTSAGRNTMYLDCGMIYRKMIFYFEDEDGNAMTPDMFTGNFEISLNTADIPYSVSPEMLQMMNIDHLGQKLPDGMYIFDFSSQSALVGHGGNRDFIDSSKVTQLCFHFNANTACKATLISERLSRLTA